MFQLAIDWLRGDDALATAVRTAVVYILALAAVRLGSKRFLAEASAFDVVVGIMLGSIMSRAITSAESMWTTLLAGAVLLAMHRAMAALAYRWDWFGPLVKGSATVLVRDGRLDENAMRSHGVSRHDLEQAIRSQGKRADPSQVRLAVLERDGRISVLPFDE
jgi:uncharacterized membrane protein YcaP (DUF421 family)